MFDEAYREYPHNPPHLFRAGATYFVTASTLAHHALMGDPRRRQECFESWRFAADRSHWSMVAWVILTDHYHLLLVAPEESGDIARLAGSVHQHTSREWNREDRARGRQVWWNFWDTCITYERSFYARINYIHWNPVKHGLVDRPEDYPFSSYRTFLEDSESLLLFWEAEYPFDRIDEEAEAAARGNAPGAWKRRTP
jgi:putative transposase